jgi:hypothetical protein
MTAFEPINSLEPPVQPQRPVIDNLAQFVRDYDHSKSCDHTEQQEFHNEQDGMASQASRPASITTLIVKSI